MEPERLLRLEELQRSVPEQPGALTQIAKQIRKSLTGLRDPSCPLAAFVFLGPGKQAKRKLAHAIAEFYFDDATAVLQIEPSSEGQRRLLEAVQRHPATVIVFDDIEQSNRKIMELFLTIRDVGHLITTEGTLVDFRRTILIANATVDCQLTDVVPRSGCPEAERVLAPEFLRVADFLVIR